MIDGKTLREFMHNNRITSSQLSSIYFHLTGVDLSPDKIRKICCGIRKINPYENRAFEKIIETKNDWSDNK